MNSLQLISKLKSKSEDLQLAVQDLNGAVLPIQKELLKKNCIELYELVLKLKTADEISEEKKPEIKFELSIPTKPEAIIETIQTPEPQIELNIQDTVEVEVPIELEKTEINPSPFVLEPEITTEQIGANKEEPEPQLEDNPIQQSFNDFIKQINLEKATLSDLS